MSRLGQFFRRLLGRKKPEVTPEQRMKQYMRRLWDLRFDLRNDPLIPTRVKFGPLLELKSAQIKLDGQIEQLRGVSAEQVRPIPPRRLP